jgi:hypothetical protein
MEIDAVDEYGKRSRMRCEMRAAGLMRRSGWSPEMFKVGMHIEVDGHPHRTDPNACYTENFKLGDAPMVNRNDQFQTKALDSSKRPLRLADGQPNISGDWAVEQLVLTVPPRGGNGSMIPKSLSPAFAAGQVTLQQVQATQPPRPKVVYTAEGQKEAGAFKGRSPKDNPWFACKPTSIIRDWTSDWGALGLLDERHAILELSKGKLTTDPKRHSGEGIFFTSRMFDEFAILSGGAFLSHQYARGKDWMLERKQPKDGTIVFMRIHNHTSRTTKKVFDAYVSGDDFDFSKTVVPVDLARYGNDKLISRSQAKRVLARVELFKTVVLDFDGVDSIGQAFSDEIFRVFANEHPDMELLVINVKSEVRRMIDRARSAKDVAESANESKGSQK